MEQVNVVELERATKAHLLLISGEERLSVREEACDANDWRWQSIEEWEGNRREMALAEQREKDEARKVEMRAALRFKKK